MFEELREKGWNIKDINHGLVISETLFKEEMDSLARTLSKFKLSTEDHFIKGGGGESDQTSHLSKKFYDEGWVKNKVSVMNKIIFENKFDEMTDQGSTYEIDHIGSNDVGEKFALEIEWNKKAEFLDRDFLNFEKLWELGVMDLGIIITRGIDLDNAIVSAVENYFRLKGIREINDFDDLKKNLTDDQGRKRFSFPTEPQRREIERSNDYFIKASSKVFCTQKYGSTTTNWKQLQKRLERGTGGRTPMIFLGIPSSTIIPLD
jgi:hypothetical protein